MRNWRCVVPLAFVSLASTFFADTALADVIDGQWCSRDGRRMLIDGDEVVTPGGTKTTGDYGLHHYIFTVPESEPHAGEDADLVLVNPDVMHLRYHIKKSADSGLPVEVWRRCNKPTS